MKACYICSSSKFVDNHHYDCLEGKLSPETVPLCRRCRRTYHDWGVGAFSPDTTAKALEVENKRREILRSLPPEHPFYNNLPAMKLEDVERSDYWYKKHGVTKPRIIGISAIKHIPRLGVEPLCGREWLAQALARAKTQPITQTMTIIFDGKEIAGFNNVGVKRGQIRRFMKEVKAAK